MLLTATAYVWLRRVEAQESDAAATRVTPCELSILAIAYVIYVFLPSNAQWDGAALALGPLAVAAWGDKRNQVLLDEIVIGALLVSLGVAIHHGTEHTAAIGMLITGGLAYLAFIATALLGRETGFGDVKYALAIGAAVGPVGGIIAYFAAAFVALIGVGAALARRRVTLYELKGLPIAYGPSLWWGMLVGVSVASTFNFQSVGGLAMMPFGSAP